MNPPKPKGFSTRPPLSYSPLDPKRRQIRLLTLHPGSWRARIRCSLTTVSLLDEPDYEALSYVWGDPQSTAPIFVDGCVFLATVNLWRALRRLRRHYPRTIWIDAICINQKDVAEKSSQVAMMKDVYSNCRQGILWLGEDLSAKKSRAHVQPTSSRFRRAKRLLEILAQNKHLPDQAWASVRSSGSSEPPVHPCYLGHLSALKQLADFDWWQRIWVVQETALPPQVEFLAASMIFSFDLIQDAWHFTAKHSTECCSSYFVRPANRDGRAFEPIRSFLLSCDVFGPRSFHGTGVERSLQQLCNDTGSFKSTLPQDRIYALIGLITHWKSASPLIPDYSLSVKECFVAAVLKMIEQDRDLSALNGRRSIYRSIPLPSWIPDRVALPVMGFSSFRTSSWNTLQSYRASGDTFSMPVPFGAGAIKVKTLKVGTVQSVGSLAPGFKKVYKRLANWRKLAGIQEHPHDDSPANSAKVELFWSVILKAVMAPAQLERFYGSGPGHIPWKEFEQAYQRGLTARAEAGDEGDNLDGTYRMTDIDIRAARNTIFATTDGRLGLGYWELQPGDEVHLLIGATAPLILRKKGNMRISIRPLRFYSVVSESYVDGIMDGEMLQGSWKERVEEIVLV
ncbi:Heterokaryon incompatibility [Macrophomina phaseolina MS6]|uniref:Heterokaryon incompatibility n=1 Tax=Macrophomina phaseolina (strain MS6) TaxID=1126212 RepID=K2QXE2_MACPH|nr:Heterokaryon incompatibility [Macrophomina phaseolina MS6]